MEVNKLLRIIKLLFHLTYLTRVVTFASKCRNLQLAAARQKDSVLSMSVRLHTLNSFQRFPHFTLLFCFPRWFETFVRYAIVSIRLLVLFYLQIKDEESKKGWVAFETFIINFIVH